MQHRSNQPLGFNQQVQKPPQVEPSNNLENLLKAYITRNDALIQGQSTTLENLENQVGQLADEFRNKPQGVVLSNIRNHLSSESSNLENLLRAYMAKNDAILRTLENQTG
ncbi:hypothetical protein EPI10_000713 [Gossypium australe]|uniref:Uncharacterized protein n=1 Tax=Gossypium australe TaxID=47621 RepID=A0A5B6V8U3_9ROSI|nr:hypothetical protein EPI10_000713 [Gossypium australe]